MNFGIQLDYARYQQSAPICAYAILHYCRFTY